MYIQAFEGARECSTCKPNSQLALPCLRLCECHLREPTQNHTHIQLHHPPRHKHTHARARTSPGCMSTVRALLSTAASTA